MLASTSDIKAKSVVHLLCDNLGRLQHPSGVVRLVQFSHNSPGLRKVAFQIAEALVMLIEGSGFFIVNGLTGAEELLNQNGYFVYPPNQDEEWKPKFNSEEIAN